LLPYTYRTLHSYPHSIPFFSTPPPTTEIYTLSLHDALPISATMKQVSWFLLGLGTTAACVVHFTPAVTPQKIPPVSPRIRARARSEEHTSELQSLRHLVCRLLLEKKKKIIVSYFYHHQIRLR